VPLPERQQASIRDSCIDCHMPRYTSQDVAHTASTDHRIVRRPNQPRPSADLAKATFVDFYQDRFPQGDPQAERNLGLGLLKMIQAGMLPRKPHGDGALGLLESALASYPQDVELRANKAQLLSLLGKHSEVLAEARLALVKRPGDWRLLACAAAAAQAEGKTDLAIDYWRRAVEINPLMPDYQVSLVGLLLSERRLDEARVRCEKLLQLDPFNVSGRQFQRQLR
jgi:tetratricopeptide (TPR) repeat protein